MTSEARSRKLLTIWEYAGELLLAALLALFLELWSGRDAIHRTLCELRGELVVATEVVLGVAAAVWVGLLAMLASNFGRWLRRKKEAYAYAAALAFPAFIYMFTLLVLLFTVCSPRRAFAFLNLFILLYGLINFLTMIRNVNGLVRLWQIWESRPRSRG